MSKLSDKTPLSFSPKEQQQTMTTKTSTSPTRANVQSSGHCQPTSAAAHLAALRRTLRHIARTTERHRGRTLDDATAAQMQDQLRAALSTLDELTAPIYATAETVQRELFDTLRRVRNLTTHMRVLERPRRQAE